VLSEGLSSDRPASVALKPFFPHARNQARWGDNDGCRMRLGIARINQEELLCRGKRKEGRAKSAEDSDYRWTRFGVRP